MICLGRLSRAQATQGQMNEDTTQALQGIKMEGGEETAGEGGRAPLRVGRQSWGIGAAEGETRNNIMGQEGGEDVTCEFSSDRIPTMRCRVVCALYDTMESFWPNRAFKRVLLPALGRPTRAIYPADASQGGVEGR